MFDYMMPALFFTSQNGSLLRESERLCIARKKSVRPHKSSLGHFEGGFYALDRLLNYRYAPHAAACLALHREWTTKPSFRRTAAIWR
jgi:hypothetical protein